ncbi:MAG: TetR/AcrR family transcriptional regulator [Rhodobiaceae bacterium]|nr:TetR/AcrR family transcriptional regulator [Rhodobiaceae bacterium]
MKTPTQSTQGSQRSNEMRERLLQATLDVILEEGWVGASTLKVCQKAGVSRGAQTHHYPTKNQLFMAAIDQIAREYEASIEQSMATLPPERKTLRAVLEIIWQSCLDDRFLQCSVEAMVVARTDDNLQKPIADLDIEAVAAMRDLADQLSDAGPQTDRIRDCIEMSIYMFRGMVIERGMHRDPKYKEHLFEVWCEVLQNGLNSG